MYSMLDSTILFDFEEKQMLASIWVSVCAYFFFRKKKKYSGGGAVSLPEVGFRIMVMLFIYQILKQN